MATTGWIGHPLRRAEDLRLLQGAGRYVDDLAWPGLLHLAVVRSSLAHAVLREVTTDAARRQPGVVAVLTAADLRGRLQPLPVHVRADAQASPVPHPVLAEGRVRYVGEPVAAVLAESRAAAVDAAERLVVDLAPLPPLLDPRDALAGHIRLHDGLPDNVFLRWRRTGGEVESAFGQAARVVRATLHMPRLAAAPIEPRGAAAAYDRGEDLLTVWGSWQDPYRPRAQLSRVLGRPEERIRVIVPDVGGAFGSKGSIGPEAALVAFLAIEHGRPVKWVEERRENLAASYQGRGMTADVELATDGGGRILALRVRLVADLGAYVYPPTLNPPVTAGMLLSGVYVIPAVDVEVLGVATTKVPTGPYRGAGRPEATYIIERAVDLAAHELGMDPVEFRRRNLVPPERFPYDNGLGHIYDSGDYGRALERVCALIDYPGQREAQRRGREEGRLVGIGISLSVERAGEQSSEHARVLVDAGGRVVVRPGSTAHGQGHQTTFAQIAADELGVPLEAVSVEQGDTAGLDRGTGTYASRSVAMGGSAVVLALREIRARMTAVAAHLLEAAPGDIEWGNGRLGVRGAPGRSLAFSAVAAAARDPKRWPPGLTAGLDVQTEFVLPGPVFPFGACAAVVEVNRETGEVDILRLDAVDDAGRIVNPLLAEGQVIGATVQGLGQMLSEEVVYDDQGQLLTASFTDYALPRAPEVPPLRSEFQETPSPWTPLGAKGIGESGAIGPPAAVANAVLDALAPLGITDLDPPFTAPKLWHRLRARGQ